MLFKFLSLFTPIAHAADSVYVLVKKINKAIINPLIVLLFALALVYFVVGLLQYLLNPSNDEERSTGRSHILWGLVGMTIMVSVWGIMTIIVNTVGADSYINDVRGEAVHIN